MKKLLSFMLVLAMVLSSVAPAMATVADDSVANLNEMGIVQGYADGTFGLENNITRAEFAAIVVRMLGLEDLAKNSVYTSQFPDVSDNWYVGYVNVAAGKGIIKGNEDGTFAPQANVTYAQAATMIVRYLGEEVEGNVWPANYLAKATELGVLDNASAAGSVMDATTRGTVFTMANNALKTGEANKPVVSKVKALVIENSRVESLSDDEIVVQVMDDYTRADMESDENDNDTFNGLKAGAQFSYTVKKNEDVEYLLGKVVNLGFTGAKVTSIEVSDEYDYVSGIVEEVESDSLEIDEKEYTVVKEDRFEETDSDRRFYQAYFNGEDKSYKSLTKEADSDDEFDFARATIKNGKVLFIDAYQFEDIAPVEDMKNDNMSVYEDHRKARIEKYDIDEDYEAKDLIKVVVEDGKVELYRLDAADIETDQVAHITTTGDEILVRTDAKFEGEYTKVRTKKVDGDDDTIIYYGDKTNEVDLDEDARRRAVFSKDGKEFDVLEDNDFKSDLKDFQDRDVEVLVDMFDKAQLIRSDFEDPRFFGVMINYLADKLDVISKGTEDDRYYLETKTDIYKFELGKDDVEDIYDPSDELKDIQEDNLDNINDDKDDKRVIVYLEVDEDDKVADTMVVLDIDDEDYFTTNIFDDNYIKNLQNKKTWEVDGNTKVFFIGKDLEGDDVEIYETVDAFLDDYDVDDDNTNKSVTAAVIAAEDTDDLADVIVVKEAVEEGDLNEDVVVEITDIDVDGDDITLVFEDENGKSDSYEVDEDTLAYYKLDNDEKSIAEELNIDRDDAEKMLLREGDIVEITYRESDKLIKSIQNLITKANDNGSYRIFRLLEVTNSNAYILGFDKDGEISKMKDSDGELKYEDEDDYYDELADMDEDDFKDIDGTQKVYINGDADKFGDKEPEFIMVHLNKNGRIDATIEIDDPADDFDVNEFATSEVDEDQVTPTPDEDEEEVTFKITENLGFYFLEVTEAPKDVDGFRFDDRNDIVELGKKDVLKSSDSKADVVLFDGDDKYATVEVELEKGTQTVKFEK